MRRPSSGFFANHRESFDRQGRTVAVFMAFYYILRRVSVQGLQSFAFESSNLKLCHSRCFSSTVREAPSSSMELEGTSEIPRVVLKRNRQTKMFLDGSQLVFFGSIDKTPKGLKAGELVQVEVPSEGSGGNQSDNLQQMKAPNKVVGWGMYNPESMYRIRILCHSLLHPEMKETVSRLCKVSRSEHNGLSDSLFNRILTMNFSKSLQTRHALGLPSGDTDTFRIVNGEGDSLSGLAVDIIGNKVAVIMSSASWCQIRKDDILKALQQVLPNHDLVWKTTPSRLKQDGSMLVDEADCHERTSEGLVALENGVKFQTFPHQRGQKTSVYCDQRENRWMVAQLCSGKRVLDLCCYHGGFSLNAARHGAKRVVGVDSSVDAIDICNANVALNDFPSESDVLFVRSDVSDFLKSCDDVFDLIVLDPPKLAPSVSALAKATRKYHSLNRDAIKLICEEGGLFLTCTCSAAMTQKNGGRHFLEMVQQASLAARREVSLLKVSGAASCHTQSPISFPAGNYLTVALFMVHPKIKEKSAELL